MMIVGIDMTVSEPNSYRKCHAANPHHNGDIENPSPALSLSDKSHRIKLMENAEKPRNDDDVRTGQTTGIPERQATLDRYAAGDPDRGRNEAHPDMPPAFRNETNPVPVAPLAKDLRVYNTATHSVEVFKPILPGRVGMYVCGATVQSSPHIGHIRAAVAFDIIRRWMERLGFKVTFIRNVTDIDDKILDKARAAGQQWWERAYIYEREFTHAYEALGVQAPTYEPRATGHIDEMVELIQRLIDAGHAYVVYDEEGRPTGNVFFDVASWPHYGELTGQKQNASTSSGADGRIDATWDADSTVTDVMGPSVDKAGDDKYNPIDPADYSPDKRDPRDFALWKASKPTDPSTARWKTPFGEGRPGWHIECSAMSHRYLGDMFDIHGGGLDLRFPHHENEMAQTRAAGWRTANVWMHSAWVTAKGEKMSKSLGNGLSVPAVLAQNSPWVVRYALGSVHYRSMLEWGDQTLAEAQAAYERISNFIARAGEVLGGQPTREQVTDVDAAELPEDFVNAMNDDFNVSGAIAAIFTMIREGNKSLGGFAQALATKPNSPEEAEHVDSQRKQATDKLAKNLLMVRAMLDVLGLDPLAQPWMDSETAGRNGSAGKSSNAEAEHKLLDKMIGHQLKAREAARKARNFAVADTIRNSLTAMGITIEDGRDGSTWSLQ